MQLKPFTTPEIQKITPDTFFYCLAQPPVQPTPSFRGYDGKTRNRKGLVSYSLTKLSMQKINKEFR